MVCQVNGVTPSNGNSAPKVTVLDSLQNEYKNVRKEQLNLAKKAQEMQQRFKELNEYELNTHRGFTYSIELENIQELDKALEAKKAQLETEIKLAKEKEKEDMSPEKYKKMSTSQLHQALIMAVKNKLPQKEVIQAELNRRIKEYGNPYLME